MKIFLDGKEIEKLDPASLPMLIHGVHGAGSSMYTIALAAKWASLGYRVLMLCGYPMAEEKYVEVYGKSDKVKFFVKENQERFLSELAHADEPQTIVMVKNLELFGEDVLDKVMSKKLYILSGDVEECSRAAVIMQTSFVTEIYFSKLSGKSVPQLEKYQAHVVSGDYIGLTSLA